MPTVGQRYKAADGKEYEYLSGDMWTPVSPVSGGRTGGGGAAVSSFSLGYQEPASVPTSNPTATSTPNINSGTGTANPAAQILTQMAKPPKTEVSREDLGGGKIRIRYSDGSVQIKNPGRAQGASVAPAPTPTAAPGPGGAPAAKEEPVKTGITSTTGIATTPTTPAYTPKEGDTRGQGAEKYVNGQWVPNTPTPPANPPAPLPSTVNPTETLIAPQDDDNPVSNAFAIQRAAAAETPAFTFSAADIANESQGLGLGQYIPTQQMMDEAVKLYEQQADQDYGTADFDLRNRYGGAGIGGQRVLDSARLAREYALGKATGGRNLRNQMMGEGFNRSLSALGMGGDVLRNRQAVGEGRYGTNLSAALSQNALQTGLVQQERQREWQAQQNQAQRIHDAATAQSLANQQGRAAMYAGLLPVALERAFPEPEGPDDAYLRAITSKIYSDAGIDPSQYGGGGGGGFDLSQFLNPQTIMQLLGVAM